MPRVTKKARLRREYTQQERIVLLTGVPLSPVSTRFGHPKTGWHVELIREAWELLRPELLALWSSDVHPCPYFRQRYGRPFAERLLSGEAPVRWGLR